MYKQIQKEFANYIKHQTLGENLQNIDIQALDLYHDLVKGNLLRFIDTCYVLTPRYLADQQQSALWQQLKDDFFIAHHNPSPYFTEIPSDFLTFCQQQHLSDELIALMQFEHAQLIAEIQAQSQQQLLYSINNAQDLDQNNRLNWSKTAQILTLPKALFHYIFPNQQFESDFSVVVWRDGQFRVIHRQIEALQSAFLHHFYENQCSSTAHLLDILVQIDKNLIQHQAWLMEQQQFWLEQGVLIADTTPQNP